MRLRADSARPQRVSGSVRIHSRRAESARNPIALHVKFGDDSALNTLTCTQWTAAFTGKPFCKNPHQCDGGVLPDSFQATTLTTGNFTEPAYSDGTSDLPYKVQTINMDVL